LRTKKRKQNDYDINHAKDRDRSTGTCYEMFGRMPKHKTIRPAHSTHMTTHNQPSYSNGKTTAPEYQIETGAADVTSKVERLQRWERLQQQQVKTTTMRTTMQDVLESSANTY
jgi:hypothetical protein